MGRAPSSAAAAVFAVGLVTFVTAVAAIDARATYGARTTSDEPQYLLTALSLAEDFDLDISDEIDERAFTPFHEVDLNTQTIDLNESGQRLSPHDPLLPVVLAVPMGLGGWEAAKATLALISALTAATTTHLAIRRFDVAPMVAALIVGGLFVSPPLTAYATQVYPEMPAAGLTVAAVGALLSPTTRPSRLGIAFIALVCLPWLAVKYVPVAAILGVALLAKTPIRHRPLLVGATAVAAATYLLAHQRIYGGWTVYAAGDHFVDGEFRVVGDNPDYVGRTRRIVGLLVDRGFGLIAWAPAWIALVPALGSMARRRVPGWVLLTSTIAAGWVVATWVALTMHGWWWPGRQLVVILPLGAIAIATMADRLRRVVPWLAAATLLAVFSWLWLVVEASTDRRTLIVDFETTASPWYRVWRLVLPDHRRLGAFDIALTAGWMALLLAVTALAVRQPATGPTDRVSEHSKALTRG